VPMMMEGIVQSGALVLGLWSLVFEILYFELCTLSFEKQSPNFTRSKQRKRL